MGLKQKQKIASSTLGVHTKQSSANSVKPRETEEHEESRWEKTWSNIKTIGGAVILALIIRTVFFEAFEIEGPSMEPTLLNGDRVVVAKYLYGLFLPFQQQNTLSWGVPDLGDVVIIKSPADNVDIVKRVIGLPGDVISIRRDVIYRNGRSLRQEDAGPCTMGNGRYRAPECRVRINKIDDIQFKTSYVSMMQNRPPIRVPDDSVFVLGDHRDASNDSRNIGPIPLDRLKGKALVIYWSSGKDGFRWRRMFSSVK